MTTPSTRLQKTGMLPKTDWSQLHRLKASSISEHPPILEVLAGKYWAPLFQYLVCRGHNEFEAQDLVQDFFVFAQQTQLFMKADARRGRFRSFLLGSLNHFAANERRKQSAQKRKPDKEVQSLDKLLDDSYFHPKSMVHSETPEVLFHRTWIREVVRNVLREMERDFTDTGKKTHLTLFLSRVVSPALDGVGPPPLKEQAQELGLEYKEAANQILTAKRAFARILEKEVRSYVLLDSDVKAERMDIQEMLRMDGCI